ncbi:hypothetical protein ACFVRB_10545 [Streptomyces nojiriensis]|uniref:hypothetical protein n=1 Tax=Streptomyces nojiriensis TaxID=66374 RepID=UPI0036DE834A
MDDESPETVWDLMFVKRRAGTHLSESSTPGALRGLARDDDNALVGHADLFPAKAAAITAAVVLLAAGTVLGVAANKAAPHVRSKLSDLRSKLNRRANDTAEATDLEAEPEPEQADVIRLRPRTFPSAGSGSAARSGDGAAG